MIYVIIFQLWISVRDPGALLSGHWQSCRDAEGWGEIAYDRVERGRQLWTMHFGPYDDFALFKGTEPEDDDHDSPLNLLAGHHAFSIPTINGRRQWAIPSLKLWVSVVNGGGSREDCIGWYIRIERKP